MCKLTIWLQHNVLLEKALDVHMDCYVTRINIVYVKYARKLLPLKVETLSKTGSPQTPQLVRLTILCRLQKNYEVKLLYC